MNAPLPALPRAWVVCAALTVAGAAFAHSQKAHQHGIGKLDVAVEGAQVTLELELPLDALVGFERAPRNDAERKTAATALARLRDGAAMFGFDAAAQCKASSVKVEAPVLEQATSAGAKDGHADLDATYVFNCAHPAQLRSLDVRLFAAFARIERIQVQAVLAKGQRSAVLRRNAAQVRLTP